MARLSQCVCTVLQPSATYLTPSVYYAFKNSAKWNLNRT